ncbi:YihY/virulence factor BrkB family protein [Demequina activiva]|uniref:YihY/virulence factor BrkB family protein n=1 Tax=Demequina activiva TaxID=1582364 RepID=A0A919PZZ1_9MICO|nr:YihY/virulence factor BrkB family protein [Demequina activiva]GIG53557.1 hypothetical protein Dac01nite_03090 [Demequina activiva]
MADRKEDSLVARGKGLVADAKTLKERFDLTHPGRTLERYSDRNGSVIAGGIAFFSLTSIAAGVLIAVTLASWFIAGDEELSSQIFDFVDQAVPGVVKDGPDDAGLVDPSTLQPTAVTGVVGFFAFLILFNTASRYVSGMRMGVWAMLEADDRSPLQGKLRDFAALVGIALMVVLGAGLQVATSVIADQVSQLLFDTAPQEWAVRLSGAAVMFLVDMAFAAIVLVYLGGVRLSRRSILVTLMVAAFGMGVLRQVMSLIISGVSNNAVLAPFAAIVTLLLFTNYTARIMLYSAAFLGTYRQLGPLTRDELAEPFLDWAVHQAGAQVEGTDPGVLRIDPGPEHVAIEMQRSTDGDITVARAAATGDPWPAMRTRSTRVAQRHAVFALAAVARKRAGIDRSLLVRSARDARLPDVTLSSTQDERFPFAVDFGGEELARFARASDAREATLYLAATIEEVVASVMEPDGGVLFGIPEGESPRLGDRVRAWLRR